MVSCFLLGLKIAAIGYKKITSSFCKIGQENFSYESVD